MNNITIKISQDGKMINEATIDLDLILGNQDKKSDADH